MDLVCQVFSGQLSLADSTTIETRGSQSQYCFRHTASDLKTFIDLGNCLVCAPLPNGGIATFGTSAFGKLTLIADSSFS